MKIPTFFSVLMAGVWALPAAVIDYDLSPPGFGHSFGLSPSNEVPAVTNSGGSGNKILTGITFDTDASTLSFAVGYGSVAGFTDLTGPATALYIHGPAPAGANAPIITNLAGHHLAAGNPAQGGILLGAVVFTPAEASNLLAGLTYINVYTATNPTGEIRGQLIPVTNVPPTIACPEPLTLECTSNCGAATMLSVDVADANGDPLTVVWTVDGTPYQTNQLPAVGPSHTTSNGAPTAAKVLFEAHFGLGPHDVAVSVSDGKAAPVSCTNTVEVVDTTPPVIRSVVATPSVLWPPNHKMVPVTITVRATDACACGRVTNRIESVRSNQGGNDGGKHAAPDWQITGPLTLKLRAERSGDEGARVYTIKVESTDAAGNKATKTVTVTVPHDQGSHDQGEDRGEDQGKEQGKGQGKGQGKD